MQSQWEDRQAWHLEEDLRIRLAEEGGLDRSTAVDLTVGPEGHIVILDDSTQVVQVFGPDGGFSHAFAPWGNDEPPGRTAGVGFDEQGSLWILHVWQGFYTVHTLRGDRTRTIEREVTGTTLPWKVRFGGDEHFHVWGIEAERSEGLLMMVPFRLSRTDGGILERGEPVTSSSALLRSRQGRVVPYRPRHRIAPGDSGRFWYAASDRYTIVERTFDGETIRAFSLDRPAPPVSQAERDSIMQWQMETWSTEEGRLEPDEIPDTKHVVHRIGVDEEGGYLYVFTTLASGIDGIDVFTVAGEFLGTLELPEPILSLPTPHVTPDHIYVGVEGEDGAKEVVRLRIVRPESG